MKERIYYGFNFQWMFSVKQPASGPDVKALDFMREVELNFVRIPVDYRFWTTGTDYFNPDPETFAVPYGYFKACEKRDLHFCLNLHRSPGYCINANHLETHNLWQDTVAQDAFVFIWERYARLFKGIPGELVSFDLINEPPAVGRYGMTRDNHAELVRRTVGAIRAVDPERPIVIDGLDGGNLTMPELADLPLIQSTRGYQPMPVTHFKAPWCAETQGIEETTYPGTHWRGQKWDRDVLRQNYRPWRELENRGVRVHVGEFGCFNTVPNRVALRWFSDLLGLFREWGWGYALWNFTGPFGIIDHGRPGTVYTEYNGYRVDKELLDLYLSHRAV